MLSSASHGPPGISIGGGYTAALRRWKGKMDQGATVEHSPQPRENSTDRDLPQSSSLNCLTGLGRGLGAVLLATTLASCTAKNLDVPIVPSDGNRPGQEPWGQQSLSPEAVAEIRGNIETLATGVLGVLDEVARENGHRNGLQLLPGDIVATFDFNGNKIGLVHCDFSPGDGDGPRRSSLQAYLIPMQAVPDRFKALAEKLHQPLENIGLPETCSFFHSCFQVIQGLFLFIGDTEILFPYQNMPQDPLKKVTK